MTAQRPERIAARIPRRPHPAPREEDFVPTAIERSYIEQGYRLPEGLTWDLVATGRARWDVDPVLVPVAHGCGCIGWGVPFVDGRPLRHL